MRIRKREKRKGKNKGSGDSGRRGSGVRKLSAILRQGRRENNLRSHSSLWLGLMEEANILLTHY